MQSCFADIINSEEAFPKVEIVPDEIPEIHLRSGPRAAAKLDFSGGRDFHSPGVPLRNKRPRSVHAGSRRSEIRSWLVFGVARLFPLPNLVLFPHVLQPLHIFEPRYCDLLEAALADDRLIAMAVLAPGWEKDYEGRPPVHPIACLGRSPRTCDCPMGGITSFWRAWPAYG